MILLEITLLFWKYLLMTEYSHQIKFSAHIALGQINDKEISIIFQETLPFLFLKETQ
jgi:hypothetical protein